MSSLTHSLVHILYFAIYLRQLNYDTVVVVVHRVCCSVNFTTIFVGCLKLKRVNQLSIACISPALK